MTTNHPGLPIPLATAIALSLLVRERRSFQQDARLWAKNLNYEIRNAENLPKCGPAVVVMNHYYRPGFQAWWFVLALAAAAPTEMHWTMTAAWTNDGTRAAKVRSIISQKFFPLLAQMYGFTSMPPMPPRPHEVEDRARAVRKLINIARGIPPPVLAIAPEGQDSDDRKLMVPHPGVGRLLAILSDLGYRFVPVGVFEEDQLILSCGFPFRLKRLPKEDREALVRDAVMWQISKQIPPSLRGIYSNQGIMEKILE